MSGRRRIASLALIAAVAMLPAIVRVQQADGAGQLCPRFGSKTTTGTIDTAAITEASGLVASRSQSGILWTHNDSGGDNRVYALSQSGRLLMTVEFGDVRVRDLEDISIGRGPGSGDYLYVADIGDNGNDRDSVRLFRFREPDVGSGSIKIPDGQVETFEFTYERPGGGTWSRNAESMAVDPINGDVIIVEKRHERRQGIPHTSWVYRIRQRDLVEGKKLVADAMVWVRTRYERDIGPPAAAEFSADGQMLVVKNGFEVFAWIRRPGATLFSEMKSNRETNCLYIGAVGEAVAVAPDGKALFFVREGRNSPVEKTDITIPTNTVTCAGEVATIVGTSGDDHITGTSGRDVIQAGGGDDVIEARGGDDVICAGTGHDEVDGGGGRDRIYGARGDDVIRGGGGKDVVSAGEGADLVLGGDHADRLNGGGGNDDLRGGPAYDRLNGGSGTDVCSVGADGGETASC